MNAKQRTAAGYDDADAMAKRFFVFAMFGVIGFITVIMALVSSAR